MWGGHRHFDSMCKLGMIVCSFHSLGTLSSTLRSSQKSKCKFVSSNNQSVRSFHMHGKLFKPALRSIFVGQNCRPYNWEALFCTFKGKISPPTTKERNTEIHRGERAGCGRQSVQCSFALPFIRFTTATTRCR